MPSAYSLSISGALMDAKPGETYGIRISGNCGTVSKVSGPGTFTPPGQWRAPSSDGEGLLGFKDKNGAQGCLPYSIAEIEFIYSPYNPGSIDCDSECQLSVIGGVPPFSWSSGCNGTHFPTAVTQGRTNTLESGDCARGDGLITVTDKDGRECSGAMSVLCPGHWEYKGSPGVIRTGDCGLMWTVADLDLIVDDKRWVMLGSLFGRCSSGGTIEWDGDDPPCGDPRSCAPGSCTTSDWCCDDPPCPGETSYDCYFYYEWECP